MHTKKLQESRAGELRYPIDRDRELIEVGRMAATFDGKNLYYRGPGTFAVAQRLHQANREKAMRHVKQKLVDGEKSSQQDLEYCLLQGGKDTCRHNTDHEDLFRQESFFHYLFGVEEPDCSGLIEVETCRTTLFVPRLPQEFAVWLGTIPSLETFKQKYGVDEVMYSDDLAAELGRLKPQRVHLLEGTNTDSGLTMKADTTVSQVPNQAPTLPRHQHQLVNTQTHCPYRSGSATLAASRSPRTCSTRPCATAGARRLPRRWR